MSESQNSYRQIMKATSLFGGVQFFNIIISLIRSKLIAILIGPAGMGIAGLLNATIGLISCFTNFGLDTSAVKSISAANADDDKAKIVNEISILKRLIWITGIFGTLITMALSSWLSQLTFGNSNYTFAFIWIAITLLLKQLSNGQIAILQGFRKLQYLAKANLYGSLFGLILTVPLYFLWGVDAIVPAIFISSLIGLLFSWYFSNKIQIESKKITNLQAFTAGKEMIKLGVSCSFIGLVSLAAGYILQIIISRQGGVVLVGLFNAGFALINTYVGLVFTAISTDYFPRLATICDDKNKVRTTVIQQALIAVLIITPIIILFLTFAPFIILILYSAKFTSIIPMVSWGILGMLFKAASWTMGYILIAKGDSKIFIKTSLGFNSLFLLNNCIAYHFYGLEGVGISFSLNFIIHFFVLKIITFNRYDFYFDREFYTIFTLSFILCLATFLFSYISFTYLKYSLMFIMIMFSSAYSLHHLNKKMNLKEILRNKIKK